MGSDEIERDLDMSRRELSEEDVRSERVSREEATNNGTEDRPKRVPISNSRDLLTVSGVPKNCVARWVNDSPPGRIQKFLDAGYTFLTADGVRTGDRTVNTGAGVGSLQTREVGGGVIAYVMVINKELYMEDQAAKQKDIKDRERAIFDRDKREIDGYGSFNQTTGIHKQ